MIQKLKAIPIGVLIISWCLILRLLTLGVSPLIDPSEARFAVAAKKMLQSGDYITPRIYVDDRRMEPYLAKPPLNAWVTSFALEVFGFNEFSVRLPAFVANLLVVFCCVLFAKKFWGETVFGTSAMFLAPLLYLATAGVFVFSYSSLTDPILAACICAAMLGFALCISGEKHWGYLFFAALGFGMLTKGPVCIALCSISILLWCLLAQSWRQLTKLPWSLGCCLFLLIWIPWYIIAEYENPGFLKYFFINENFLRYLVHDFGNHYGTAHMHSYGMIWPMFFAVFLPWSFLLPFLFTKRAKEIFAADSMLLFLLAWGLSSLLFFSFARQIIATYAFPAIVPFVLILARLLPEIVSTKLLEKIPAIALCCIFLYVAAIFGTRDTLGSLRSTKSVLEYAQSQSIRRIGILSQHPHSAHFYTGIGQFADLTITTALTLQQALTQKPELLMVRSPDYDKLSAEERSHFDIHEQIGRWILLSPKT